MDAEIQTNERYTFLFSSSESLIRLNVRWFVLFFVEANLAQHDNNIESADEDYVT